MADEQDWCLAMKEIVDSVYNYLSFDDPDWDCAQTPEAQKSRAIMEKRVQKFAIKLNGRPFNREQLDEIFGWESE